MSGELPSLFIASSAESLEIAQAIQHGLEYNTEPTIWNQGTFTPGSSLLKELVASLRRFEFAVFVFSGDDTLRLRNRELPAVRDNVIFELGLFMGALGPDRCFCLRPRSETGLHLPSDLAGIGLLTFDDRRRDKNMIAAVGPACTEIRNAIRRIASADPVSPANIPVKIFAESASAKLNRLLHIWNGETMRKDRDLVRGQGVPNSPYEVDRNSSAEWNAFNRIFWFLEAVSAAVLAGEVDANAARVEFGNSVQSVWSVGQTALAIPNHAQEAWNPLPNIALVAKEWQA